MAKNKNLAQAKKAKNDEFDWFELTPSQKAKKKYDHLHKQFPKRFPERRQSKFEQALDDINSKDEDIQNLLKDFIPTCNKDITKLNASEIIQCQKNCPVDNFYEPKKWYNFGTKYIKNLNKFYSKKIIHYLLFIL